MSAKKQLAARVDADLLAALNDYAEGEGITRTEAVERLLRAGMAQGGQKVGEDADGAATGGTEALQAIVDVLRDSNRDLRATVSTLTAQLAVKDEQISRAHDLADHAQALHMQAAQRALPPEGGTVRGRIASLFRRGANND